MYKAGLDAAAFLAHNANADSRDKNGQTPLSLAAEGGFAEVVEILLATDGVDPNARDHKGRTLP